MKTAHRMRFDIGRAICAKLFCCAAIFVFIVTSAKNASAQIVLPASGYIKTIVGTGGTCGFAGDGGLATSARLCYPQGVAVDGSGNVYIADYGNHSIRKVTASTGVISTVAGIGGSGGYSGDGGQATSAQLALPMAVAIDSSGNMYIADYGNDLIRKVNSSGVISTFAGTYNSKGYTGDGGAATSAQLNNPIGVAVDASGNVYIVDSANNAIRKVTVSTGVISTYAGGPNANCYTNCSASDTILNYPYDVAVDASGNVYISEYWGGFIAEGTASTGIVNTIVGSSPMGYSGDGGPALSAQLYYPAGVAVDTHGNVYVSDEANVRIRKITASTGIINTIAGNGTAGYSGDGGLATNAEINYSNGVAVDASGNVYFVDISDNLIRVVGGSSTTPSISVATSGTPSAFGAAVTFTGTVTSGDTNQVIFYSGSTSLGTATPNSSGTATLTTSSLSLGSNSITASIAAGGGYSAATSSAITQTVNQAAPTISVWPTPGAIIFGETLASSTLSGGTASVAGTFAWTTSSTAPNAGTPSESVKFTPTNTTDYTTVSGAVNVTVYQAIPTISVNSSPNPSAYGNSVTFTASVTSADANTVTFFNGSTSLGAATPISGTATLTINNLPAGSNSITAEIAAGGNYAAATSYSITQTVNQPTARIINTFAGTGGSCGYGGDGGAATSARLCYPEGVTVDTSGNVYIADYGNHAIRKVTASTGVISTVAGIGGSGGYSGDGGQATSAQLALPMAVAIDSSGNMYIADYGNDLIRKVNSSGVISTFAGTYNSKGYTGDGGAATSAQLNNPIGVAVDASGNVYIVDSANNAIRKVTVSTGIISTYEGGPNASCYGNCPATNAVLNYPYDVAVDASGNVYTSEYWGGLIAEVTASTEIMNIVAGVGSLGYSGDDGPATSAHLNYPAGVAVDAHGNVYIVDSANLRIRKVTASTGVINTIAGNGTAGYTGDGGLATDAEINYSNGAAVDASGNFYFADVSDNVIRVLSGSATTPSIAVATSGTPSVYGTTVTFTATVTSGDTNQVTFYSGGTSLGTATPNSSGAATLTTSSLAVGSDAITASIAAGGNYGAATSSGITQMVDSAGSNWDAGTVTLTVYNSSNSAIFSQSASYGQGSTPNSVAEGLAGSNSNINATAVNDTLYVEAAGTGGANTDSYYYTVTQQSTAGFAPASFQGAPASGDLSGGANASGTQSVVYAYCIGTTTSYCSSPSPGYDPVGNVVNYSDINSSGGSVMGTWGYSYDSLNRLTSGQNAATTSTSQQYAGQNLCWVYDSFGNRTVQSQQSGTCPASSSSTPMWVYNANNQVSGVIPPGGSQASPSPYTYDQAGDVTQDYTTGNQYLYDAEGRICASQSRSGVGGWIMSGYVYDADGTRVAKGTITSWSCDPSVNGLATAGNETDYVLGPGGEQVTELAQDANGSMNWQRTYVDAAGALIATYGPVPNPAYNPSNPSAAPQTVYLPSFRFTDWLGTMRATTDSYGVAQGTCAGLPFGDSQACSGNIPDPHYLTGKERDAESGNDYFGARYYASTMGRFLSPDWSAKVEPVPYSKVDNPQTLNLYAYVLNNPLTRFDPDGHEVDLNGTDKQKAEEQSRLAANATRTDKNGLKESSLFKNVTDKSGKTTMVLDKAAAANWSGGHSQGFKDIVQTINNKDVVSVNLVNTDENQTRFDGNGHFTVNLATNQTALDRIAPLKNGNSLDIIAGHEILGHARMGMLGIPDWNRDGPGSPVFQYENNVLRPEYMQAHPNGPITGPRLDNEP